MSHVLVLLAAAATQPTTPPPWYVQFLQSPIALMVIVLVIFYFMMIRTKRNQERDRQNMLNQLKRNDRVQTIGGIVGTVVDVRDSEVVVKVDENTNTKIRFLRSAIHRVVEEEKPQGK